MIDDFFHLHNFRFFNNQWVTQVHLFDDCGLDALDDRFLYELLNNYQSFMDYRNLNYSLDLTRNFFYNLYYLSHNLLNLFNSLFYDDFLSNNFYFLNSCFDMNNLNNFLNNLRNLNYSFNNLYNRDRLLNNSFYNLMLNFNMIQNFSCITIFNNRYNFFNYFFYFNNLRNFHYSFNNFLNKNWNFHNFLYNLFHWDYFLLD